MNNLIDDIANMRNDIENCKRIDISNGVRKIWQK